MFSTLLLPMDPYRGTDPALDVALAHVHAFQGQLHLVSVVPELDTGRNLRYSRSYHQQRLQEARERQQGFVREHLPADLPVQAQVRHGVVYKEILDAAQDLQADLIIMGTHRPESPDYLLGSNAARVVRHTRCSVLVVRS